MLGDAPNESPKPESPPPKPGKLLPPDTHRAMSYEGGTKKASNRSSIKTFIIRTFKILSGDLESILSSPWTFIGFYITAFVGFGWITHKSSTWNQLEKKYAIWKRSYVNNLNKELPGFD